MKTAVETIFVGKDRQYNRRFLQMCSHHLVEPVACTPASGWERAKSKPGRPRPRTLLHAAAAIQELRRTQRLAFRPVSVLGESARPSRAARQTIWEVFEAERPKLIPYRGRFDGFHALPASVSKTCLVRFDNNNTRSARARSAAPSTSTPTPIGSSSARKDARWPNTPAATARERPSTIPGITCRFWRASRALYETGRFKDWVLPAALDRVRRKLAGSNDGDRQMVKILAAVLIDGLPAVEAACVQALAEGVHSADVVINILARQRDPAPLETIQTPDSLPPRHAPTADCARYDQLRSA